MTQQHKLSILIAENDSHMAKQIHQVIISYHHQAYITTTAKATIDFLSKIKVDIIIIDFNLPDSSCKNLLAKLKNQKINTPCIVISDKEDLKHSIDTIKAGACSFITKPSDIYSLLPSLISQKADQLKQMKQFEKTKKALKQSEMLYKSLFHHSPHGIALAEIHGSIKKFNNTLCEITGYPPLEMHTIDISKLFKHPHLRNTIDQTLSNNCGIFDFEFESICADRTLKWISLTATPVMIDDKPMAICIVQDITKRKNTEEKEQQQKADLDHRSRINSIGEIASEITHELSQPLCSIANNTSACLRIMTSRNNTPSEEIFLGLKETEKQAQKANEIIRRVRCFTQKRNLIKTQSCINIITNNAINSIKPSADTNNINIHCKHSAKLPRIFVDAIQIEQVTTNLLTNAIDSIVESCNTKRKLILSTHKIIIQSK